MPEWARGCPIKNDEGVTGKASGSFPGSMRSRPTSGKLLALAVLVVLTGVFYWSFLTSGSYCWEDLLFSYYPMANHLSSALAAGRFPLWISGVRVGIPGCSDFGMMSLYPPSWLLCLGVDSLSRLSVSFYQWYLVSHIVLAGYFTYAFLRRNNLGMQASMVGACVFSFGGFTSLHLIHANMLIAGAWLPIQMYCVKRYKDDENLGNYVYCVISVLGMMLAGFPQILVYSAYFVTAYGVWLSRVRVTSQSVAGWKTKLVRLLSEGGMIASVFLCAALLAAVQYIPAAENWRQSHREQFGFAQIADLSLPWYYLIHGLVPNFFGASNGDGSGIPFWGFNRDTIDFRNWHAGAWMYWDFGFYAGQLALIAIVVLAFNVRKLWRERPEGVFFLVICPLVLWLMLGRYGGLFQLFYHVVPGFSMFRSPARIGCLFDFSAAVLAAILVDSLWRGRPALELRKPLWLLGGVYGVLFFGVLVYGSSMFPELKEPRLLQNSLTQIGLSVVLFGGIAGLLVLLKRLGSSRSSQNTPDAEAGVPPGVKSRIVTDIGRVGGRADRLHGNVNAVHQVARVADGSPEGKYVSIGRQVVLWGLVALTFLDLYLAFHKFHQGGVNPEAYYADRNGLIAQMTKLREQEGSFRFAQLRDGKISEEVVFPRNIGYLYPGYEALEGYILFNLKEFGAFSSMTTNERIRLDIQNVGVVANLDSKTRQVGLMRYTNSLPRAKFYHALRAYPDTKAIYADLDSGRLDYQRAAGVLVEDCARLGIPTGVPPVKAEATVTFIPVTPDEYRIEYRTTTPGVIFVSESFYPGWVANDGQFPIIRAFGAFKGIVVREAGQGVITVKFSPWTFKAGLAISLTTLAGLIGAWVWAGRKRTVIRWQRFVNIMLIVM